jgi:RNA polymerase sigma factor (TIGR02999 family)
MADGPVADAPIVNSSTAAQRVADTPTAAPVTQNRTADINRLLDDAEAGESSVAADLLPQVYDELRILAGRLLAGEASGQTLQPTALVHEAYVRLVGRDDRPRWQSHGQFLTAAAQAMRHILVDVARRKKRQKHGGNLIRVPLEPEQIAEPQLANNLLALNSALNALAEVEPAVARLVELRYFGGLTLKETAEVLGIAPRTADAHWA